MNVVINDPSCLAFHLISDVNSVNIRDEKTQLNSVIKDKKGTENKEFDS